MPAAALLLPVALLAAGALLAGAAGRVRPGAGRTPVALFAWAALAALLLLWVPQRNPIDLNLGDLGAGIRFVLRLDAVSFAFSLFVLLPSALLLTFQPNPSPPLAALATVFVALVWRSVALQAYSGDAPVLNALAAAFAVSLPGATIFLIILPIQARLLLPITAGITLLSMIFAGSAAPFLPHAFGIGTGVLLAGGVRSPRQLWLRVRVWWIDRRLRSRRLRVVRGEDDQPGRGRSGSDKYLH